jgi:hypothetical protein
MKWIPTIVTVVLGLVGAFNPQVQSLVVNHPSSAAVFAAIYAVVKGLAASPLGKGVQ